MSNHKRFKNLTVGLVGARLSPQILVIDLLFPFWHPHSAGPAYIVSPVISVIDLHNVKTCKYFAQCPTSFRRRLIKPRWSSGNTLAFNAENLGSIPGLIAASRTISQVGRQRTE